MFEKMDDPLNTKYTLLERVKLQTEIIIPILEALREELGEKRANEIVYSALREWWRQSYRKIGAQSSDRGKTKWENISKELDELIGDDVEVKNLEEDPDSLEFDVTGCRYAQFFLELGEPELGAIMTCEIDDHVAALGYPEVTLSRPQTIMGGAKKCHFRYRFKKIKDG